MWRRLLSTCNRAATAHPQRRCKKYGEVDPVVLCSYTMLCLPYRVAADILYAMPLSHYMSHHNHDTCHAAITPCMLCLVMICPIRLGCLGCPAPEKHTRRARGQRRGHSLGPALARLRAARRPRRKPRRERRRPGRRLGLSLGGPRRGAPPPLVALELAHGPRRGGPHYGAPLRRGRRAAVGGPVLQVLVARVAGAAARAREPPAVGCQEAGR